MWWGGIRFLWAINHSAAEIHHELHAIYGPSIMSKCVVHQWVWFLKNERTNIYNEKRSGRLSFVSGDLWNKVNEKVRENYRFTTLELSDYFPEISWNLLHETVTEKTGYHKFCVCWVGLDGVKRHKKNKSAIFQSVIIIFFFQISLSFRF